MKKSFSTLLVFVGLVFFASACNQDVPAVQTNPQVPQYQPTAPMPTIPTAPATSVSTQTYTNSSYNFSFVYPNSFTFVTPEYGTLPNQIVQVQLGSSAYPKTNFADAGFTVSENYEKTLADCIGSANTKKVINGVTFYFDPNATGGGAGAGNLYTSTDYRTYSESTCLALTETIHTGNIGNYPSGTVTEVNQTPIQAQLDQILESFKFTN